MTTIHEAWLPERIVIDAIEAIPTNYEMSDDEFNCKIIDMHLAQHVADSAIFKVLEGDA